MYNNVKSDFFFLLQTFWFKKYITGTCYKVHLDNIYYIYLHVVIILDKSLC